MVSKTHVQHRIYLYLDVFLSLKWASILVKLISKMNCDLIFKLVFIQSLQENFEDELAEKSKNQEERLREVLLKAIKNKQPSNENEAENEDGENPDDIQANSLYRSRAGSHFYGTEY
jgi:hypothetical protein